MRKQIHMINRKGVFYFRRRVPPLVAMSTTSDDDTDAPF